MTFTCSTLRFASHSIRSIRPGCPSPRLPLWSRRYAENCLISGFAEIPQSLILFVSCPPHLMNAQTLLTWWQPIVHGVKPAPRAAHSATVVGNKIFIFGGNDGTTLFNDLHVLDTGASRVAFSTFARRHGSSRSFEYFRPNHRRHSDVVSARHTRLSAASARWSFGDAGWH